MAVIEWGLTARVERPPLHRGGSASKGPTRLVPTLNPPPALLETADSESGFAFQVVDRISLAWCSLPLGSARIGRRRDG